MTPQKTFGDKVHDVGTDIKEVGVDIKDKVSNYSINPQISIQLIIIIIIIILY